MRTLDIFDPPLCCPTGICGVNVNPALVELAALLPRLGRVGVKVRRFNLAQQPMAFASEPIIQELLRTSGVDGLPAFLVDGHLVLNGRYPLGTELSEWLKSSAALLP